MHAKSTRPLRFCSGDLNPPAMNSIFLFPCGNRAPNPPPLKALSTYEERLATLKPCRRFLETPRHSKAVMAGAGFSGGGNDSDANVMQCTTCSLLIYSGYFTPEPLKKHLQNASHCTLAIQLQQEAESKHVVEKPKIESPSAPAPPVKPKSLGTYEERLASFQYWIWAKTGPTKELLAAAGFKCTDGGYRARCMHCSLKVAGNRNFEPLQEHLQKSPECPLVLQLEATGLGTPEAIAEASKPTPVAADIGYFDATLLCDIQEFGLHHEAASFCQHLQGIQANYREGELLALLPECLRGPALAWYKQQQSELEAETAKKSLSEWLEALATAFPPKPPAKSSIQTTAVPPAPPPPQYHSCLNCSASFSSLARLLQHTQTACQKAVCKHCEGTFDSKNKLHEHLRQHHAKEVVKDASGRSCNREGDKTSPTTSTTSHTTPPTSPKTTTTKFSISRPVTPPERPTNPPTPPATPATPEQITSSKRSRLPLPTYKNTPKSVETASKPVETASFNCPPTPPATPAPRPRKSASKPHLTIDDLVRMFRGKPRPFGLPQHQKRRHSPRNPGTTYQSRITAYFLPAANQKAPISQGLKSPNPKSFQQHTPAESIPPCRPALPEKSALPPYKKAGISYTSLQSRSSPRSSILRSRSPFSWSPPTSPPSSRSPPPDLHVCCTCFGRSSFHNGLFDYRRLRHRYPSNRRPIGGGMVG